MAKSELKLILCWALVNVGSAVAVADAPPLFVANVNWICHGNNDAVHEHCTEAIVEGGNTTPEHKMMDIFNRCVFHETGADFGFANPFSSDRRKRPLRTARSLEKCWERPCLEEACCMQHTNLCGSSCGAYCPCDSRRLEDDEDEIISILQGRQLPVLTTTSDLAVNVVAKCTAEVRLLAVLLNVEDNLCLGSVPGQVECAVTMITG
jgi:hypothetical protein